jgi:hypothetical protein
MPEIPITNNRRNSKGTCNPLKHGENDLVKDKHAKSP